MAYAVGVGGRAFKARIFQTIIVSVLVTTSVPAWSAQTQTQTPTLTLPYTGWAIVAYPSDIQVQTETAPRRMKAAGANMAWIGHNNPGEVAVDKVEPGLSYAVFAAAQDSTSAWYVAAQAR